MPLFRGKAAKDANPILVVTTCTEAFIPGPVIVTITVAPLTAPSALPIVTYPRKPRNPTYGVTVSPVTQTFCPLGGATTVIVFDPARSLLLGLLSVSGEIEACAVKVYACNVVAFVVAQVKVSVVDCPLVNVIVWAVGSPAPFVGLLVSDTGKVSLYEPMFFTPTEIVADCP